MCLHLVGFITIYVLPRFMRGEKRAAAEKTASATAANETVSNGFHSKQSIVSSSISSSSPSEEEAVDNGHPTHSVQLSNGDTRRKTCDKTTIHSNGIHQQPKINGHVSNNLIDDEQQQLQRGDNLSHLIRKRIDSETRNLEKLVETSLDKTVMGIVEFKDDLMRVSNDERLATGVDLRQRNTSKHGGTNDGVDAFLKREINVAVNQVNVLPAVLSNGHGAD